MKENFKFIGGIILIIVVVISIVQGAFLLVGPSYKEGTYTMVYKVYYPNNPRTYTLVNDYPISTYSSRGTNYIYKTIKTPFFKKMYRSHTEFSTSAPIEVVSYTFTEE